jgi:hypothetical protein
MALWQGSFPQPVARCRRVAAISAVALLVGCGDEVHMEPDYVDKLQGPVAAREHTAARHALDFAATLQRGDAPAACAVARGAAWAMLNCSRTPRIPKWLRIPPQEKLEVIHAYPGDVPKAIRLGLDTSIVSLLGIEVDEAGHVVLLTAYGFA